MIRVPEGWSAPNFEVFADRHAAWRDRLPAGPLYCLPEKVIARLGQTFARRHALLDGAAVKAEHDLFRLCRATKAVGYDGPRPINYPFLTPPIPLPSPEEFPQLEWLKTKRLVLEEALAKAAHANERLQGYVGWLATEPPFLEAIQGLETKWRSLPEGTRPVFPLLRPPAISRVPLGSSPATAEVAAFSAEYAAFCERWGLVAMATWHLPLPQGPLLPSLVPGGSPALPAEAVHLVLPAHYPLAGDDDLLALIQGQQRLLSEQLGLDPSVAGLPHHKIYSQMFEVSHHERTIVGRYGGAPRPRRFVDALVEALAESSDQSVDQIRRLRKEISACRRGRRASVARLRVSPR